MENFTFENFSNAFGITCEDKNLISLKEKIDKSNFKYARLEQKQRDQLICSILKKIDGFSKVGAHRNNIWDQAWKKISDSYQNNSHEVGSLFPSFVSATHIVRLNGDYALPESPSFEKDLFCIFREWLFKSYLNNYDSVYEFGCGSGYNLVALSELYPDKTLYGLDWSESAVNLIEKIRKDHSIRIEGKLFDFFNPDPSLKLNKNSAVMTFCALEQTGDKWEPFILWLLEQKPGIVINMEPISDFYNSEMLVDHLALSYHHQRGYLSGYFPFLQKLEQEKKIKLEKYKRLEFGSLYHEGYNIVVWKPTE